MHLNWQITPITMIAVASGLACTLLGHFLPLGQGLTVILIEQIQMLWLLFCSIYASTIFIRSKKIQHNHYAAAWIAAMWWLLLGRSIGWGRDYLDQLPHDYFRPIAIILILMPLLLLCLKQTRQQIKNLAQNFWWPIWTILLIVLFFAVAQTIESERMFQRLPSFIDPDRRDLIEELFEIPFMFFLFWVNRDLYLNHFFKTKKYN